MPGSFIWPAIRFVPRERAARDQFDAFFFHVGGDFGGQVTLVVAANCYFHLLYILLVKRIGGRC